MTKVPLSQSGVQSIQDQLYALPNQALQAEVLAVRNNFATWTDNHFVINDKQRSWLAQMDPLFRDYIGIRMAIAIKNKLPWVIVLPPAPAPGDPDKGKWFMEKSTIETVWSGPEEVIANGVLKLEFGYHP
ncbi:MAG: hypothetical protein P0Y49_09305 [Candidatus Pedobacter colombiensis]|uniref:Uncharacterized protein n=1 Tax=Candidatus Pedobacter colombiensis TaxID=3121371 RepID=A0AAJ5WB52_9SPHI|nr:hypothetical protein [Pedobacter sp.]WEK21337.1 MAG: hypothetical protein P0Y49_09305 [Pedobacter sp.]